MQQPRPTEDEPTLSRPAAGTPPGQPRRPSRARTLIGAGVQRCAHQPVEPGPLGRTPRPGDRLGQYKLCLELARGGMATLYLARIEGRTGLHRFVALKCIRPELAVDERFVGMFYDEARIASRIYHANVCSILDFDSQRGVHYLAMEFLYGQPLGAIRRRLGPLRADSTAAEVAARAGLVARIIADAAEGLHAAHELRDADGELLQVVHRDVSPENIFVTYDGTVKLLDFGIASAQCQQHRTATGVIKGKYGYLQPEALLGKKPDRRADIWGLGVVAWELLTGVRLFERATEVEALQAIDRMDIPPPSKLCAAVPPLLDDLVMRALERDPDKRFATARELGQACNRFLVEERLPFDLAEVSDLMAELFPDGPAVARQVIDAAEKLATPPGGVDEDSIEIPIELCTPINDAETAVRPAPAPAPQMRGWLAVAGAVAVALVLALAGGLGDDAADRTQTSAGPDALGASPAADPALPPGAGARETPSLTIDHSAFGKDVNVEVVPMPADDQGKSMMVVRIAPRGKTPAAKPATKSAPRRVERQRTAPRPSPSDLVEPSGPSALLAPL